MFPKNKTFIAAEIGINHNGDMKLAKEMIKMAKESGADAVKFQNYKTEDFILNKEIKYKYMSQGKLKEEYQFEMFKRYELNFTQLQDLKSFSDELGIVFFSTPTGISGINELLKLNVKFLKNGSDFIQNLPLIKEMGKTALPCILSTGMSTLSHIDEAVNAFESGGGKEMVILHCVSQYPTPNNEVNLRKINSLKLAFGYPVGFSDHTYGSTAALGAVALGACFIEKHFTLSHDLPGPDHRFSSTPEEFLELTTKIRLLEDSLGESRIEPTNKEKLNAKSFQLSCVAKTNIKSGSKIKSSHISFSRPGSGLSPKMYSYLIGKILVKDKIKGEIFRISDLK